MCGFAGIARRSSRAITPEQLLRMAASIRHRGPDGYGWFRDAGIGLAHVRLSIVDPAGGAQPLCNADGSIVVVYNGEIYNHVELRQILADRGHRFQTRCDTEVLVHGYREWGEQLLERLNGQFSFALYDRAGDAVLLARDRFGVRPLFYTVKDGDLIFASEAKAIFASGEVDPAPDLAGLDEVFTFWGARAPRTVFRGLHSLPPGHLARWQRGRLDVRPFYSLNFPAADREPDDAMAALDELMRSSVAMRMRADVPVGGYLSGGLDSTITCTLAAGHSPHALRTFSVSFEDPRLDESEFQKLVAGDIRSEHHVQSIGDAEIAAVFPRVIYHTETPLVRTAPAPLFLLSRLTRQGGIKVVLTGEGADELFLGYDLFKETALRQFCGRQPGSTRRPRLFDRLYPYLMHGGRGGEMWRRFFLEAGDAGDPLFSHLPRFLLTSRIKDFYSAEARAELSGFDAMGELRDSLPPEFGSWSPLHRAAYLEMTTLLASYLLSSQGDRMSMAHGVEGRFPFLDHRLFELCASLPARSKLRGLREKDILRRWARDVVPARLAQRPKQPYRAPDTPAFFGATPLDYVEDLMDADAISRVGIFDPAAVSGLVRRCRSGLATGFRESQALVAILSTQLWYDAYCRSYQSPDPLPPRAADVALDERYVAASSL